MPHFNENDERDKKGRVSLATLGRVMPFFRGRPLSLIFAVSATLLITGLGALIPVVFRHMLDKAIPSGQIDQILYTGSIYLGLLVVSGMLGYFQSIIISYMGLEIVNTIKTTLFGHMLKLSIRYFDKNVTGRLISRIESDSQRLFSLFSSTGLQMLSALLNLIIALAVIIYSSIKITMLLLVIMPFFILGAWLVFTKLRPMYRRERELYSHIIGFLGEHLKALPVLKNLGKLEWSRNKLRDYNESKRAYELKINILEQTTWFGMMLVPQLGTAALFWWGAEWIQAGTMTFGTVFMLLSYVQTAIWPLIQLSEQVGEIQRAFGAADRIFEILDTEPEVKNCPVCSDFHFNQRIEFNNVSFYYDEQKPVLKHVSFVIDKGSTVAVVGPTGSGKTTLINLLARFYDPVEGNITIDGVDLRQLKQEDLRACMSLVLQDIYLFPGNLLDNLRVLRQDIPDEQVMQAAGNLGITEFIERLPGSWKTELAENGGNLSFGERQLLSFARALTFSPEILVMDEATSSVDPYTESLLQKSLDKLVEQRTAIIIAHRLSTIAHADKILVIDDGMLVEEGTHAQLMAMDGIYADLYRTQLGGENA